jgi:hypothetical protein
MKNLELNQMDSIQGGSWGGWFCAGAYVASVVAPNPVTGAAALGCAIYGLF